MGIYVEKAGPLTTVQDLGRWGYQSQGLSVGGAMDVRSLKIANLLLDNDPGEAALEFALLGPRLKFTSDAVAAITGGDFRPMLGGKPVPMYTAFPVKKGEVLTLGAAAQGSWGYLAAAGGFDLPEALGSRSTNLRAHLGGLEGRALAEGDELSLREQKATLPYLAYRRIRPERFDNEAVTLRVVPGPQTEAFTPEGIRTFLEGEYMVTEDFDRMGCRLSGPAAETRDTADILSDGIAPGAIQITSQGQPIILLADRQTTGGYAKIATVISADIPRLVQSRPGQTVRFEAVSVETAQQIWRGEQEELRALGESFRRNNWDIRTGVRNCAAKRITGRRISKRRRGRTGRVCTR